MKKKISPLYPLSCWLRNKHTSNHGFHIAVAIHSCSILTESRVHFSGYAPIFPLSNPRLSLLPYTILLARLISTFFLSSPSRYQSTPSSADLLSDYLHFLSNPIIPHSIHMAKHSFVFRKTPLFVNSRFYPF